MAYVETWDETKPAGSRDANLGDDDIREFKRGIRERLAGGGQYFPSTDDADAGKYKWINFMEQSSNPASAANEGFLFTKDVSGVTELYWMDSAGTVTQLTSGGKILISSLVIASEAQGDLISRGASAWGRLAKGSALQYLRVNSGGTDLEYADLAFQTAATQAEMEAASSLTVPVTPGRAQYHPGVAKAWCYFNGGTAGTNAPTLGHNVATVTRNGTGDYTVNFTTAFSSAAMAAFGSANAGNFVQIITLGTSSCRIYVYDYNGAPTDAAYVSFLAFGDQ